VPTLAHSSCGQNTKTGMDSYLNNKKKSQFNSFFARDLGRISLRIFFCKPRHTKTGQRLSLPEKKNELRSQKKKA
jgi:hypothetical protein